MDPKFLRECCTSTKFGNWNSKLWLRYLQSCRTFSCFHTES